MASLFYTENPNYLKQYIVFFNTGHKSRKKEDFIMDLIIITLIVMAVDIAAILLIESKFNGKKSPGLERIKE